MEFGWQDLVAIAIIVAAAGYLANLAWSAVRRGKSGGCGGGCAKCSTGTAQVVTIGGAAPRRT